MKGKVPVIITSILLIIAGWVHLDIAPFHFSHMPGHGLFFSLTGLAQILVVPFLLFTSQKLWVRTLALTLTGGMVLIWLVTQTGYAPFTHAAEPIDNPTIISKLAEAFGFAVLLVSFNQKQVSVTKPLILSMVLLMGTFISGFALEATPLGGDGQGHAHAEGEDHGNEGYGGDYGWKEVFQSLNSYFSNRGTKNTYAWNLPQGFPQPRVPKENPMTKEKVELGRYLFYDKRLSGNGTMSCSSCHHQDKAFSDGLTLPKGSTGMTHPRNSLSLTNSAYSSSLTWANPALVTLESQIKVPMFGEFPVELGITGKEEEVLDRFRQDSLYQAMFVASFPTQADPYNYNTIVQALASFTRTLISGDSPYDRYIYGKDTTALSNTEIRGLRVFLSEELECHHCHGGFNFTLSTVHDKTVFVEKPFHNTGLYNLNGMGNYPPDNVGVFEFTAKASDMGKFRAPTLRNIALTAPYMHDGSIQTLEEVIAFYERGGRNIESGPLKGDGKMNQHKSGFVAGFTLTDQEREDLLAFLRALTDQKFITNLAFSDPFVEERP